MILRFLRLFHAFRMLEGDLARIREDAKAFDLYHEQNMKRIADTTARLESQLEQSRNESLRLREQCDRWEADYKAMVEKRIESVETVADFESLRLFGRTIYGRVAPVPVPETGISEAKPPRVHARSVVQQMTEKYNLQMAAFYRNGGKPEPESSYEPTEEPATS